MSAAAGSEMGRRGGDSSAVAAGVGNNGDEFATMPVSFVDLQNDDDKSSLESGQVSPEACEESERQVTTTLGGFPQTGTPGGGAF